MLFHITATHTVDDCPGYNKDRMPEFIKAGPGMMEKAKELGVKVHFNVQAAPEHTGFLLLEADDPYTVALFLSEGPLKQDFKMSAVVHQQDLSKRAAEYYGIS